MTYLPDEIWHMVCTLIWHQRDFDTLFNCACSEKQLAAIAVMYLYRMHDEAPELDHAIRGRTIHICNFRRWICRWRTIVLSSLGKTLYPYSQYIRMLDLGDLKSLLREADVSNTYNQAFFQGELQQFAVVATKSHYQLDIAETTNKIGEAITKRNPRLEVLTGNGLGEALTRLKPRLLRLKHVEPFPNRSISGSASLIRLCCSSSKGLNVHNPIDYDSDLGLATFLKTLRPQSLESFQASYPNTLGPNSFRALSCHQGESLMELTLEGLKPAIAFEIPLLKGCTNLVLLSLSAIHADFESNHRGVFLKTLAWLKECKKLQILACDDFSSAPALMTRAFSENNLHLTSFEYRGRLGRGEDQAHEKFHQALRNQTSMQKLCLNGEVDPDPLDGGTLVESLSKLVNLTELCLGDISRSFLDQHIVQLVLSLPKLQVLSMSGYRLTDAIWDGLASLRWLRRLELHRTMSFPAARILGFLEKLGPGNQGLCLFITTEYWDRETHLEKVLSIQEMMAERVQGRFKCIPLMSSDPRLACFINYWGRACDSEE